MPKGGRKWSFGRVSGSFGIIPKEPISSCFVRRSLLVLSLSSFSVYSHPNYRFQHRNFIFGVVLHTFPMYVHIKYKVSVIYIFQVAVILFVFFLLLFLAHLVYQPKNLIQSCFVHCASLVLVSVSVHTSPSHRIKQKLHTWYRYAPLSCICMQDI